MKFVKKASQWCVTIMIKGKKKNTQNQHWFDTKEQAEQFENESVRKEQNGNNK